MSKAVIFGCRDFASLAHFYLKHDSDHEVVAFSVHRDYLPVEPEFEGLPIIALEDVASICPPISHLFFAPMSSSNMNRDRAKVYNDLKSMGYELLSYVSSRATTFSDFNCGDNCFILEDNTIQPYVRIGSNVVLWSGNHIGHHSTIRDHVLFTSHVVLSGHCEVGAYSMLGVNSTVRDGMTIAEGSLVAMSASIVKPTEPWGVYKGVPAKRSADID